MLAALQCLKEQMCLKNWIASNFLWGIFYFSVIFVFSKFIPRSVNAIIITRKILRDNRDTRGNAWGKYSADRFVDVWCSNDNLPLRHEVGKFYYATFNNPNSRHWMDVIDRELVGLGLIEIFDSHRGYKAVRPVRNWRNRLVYCMVKFYLVHFIGDNPQHYRAK